MDPENGTLKDCFPLQTSGDDLFHLSVEMFLPVG